LESEVAERRGRFASGWRGSDICEPSSASPSFSVSVASCRCAALAARYVGLCSLSPTSPSPSPPDAEPESPSSILSAVPNTPFLILLPSSRPASTVPSASTFTSLRQCRCCWCCCAACNTASPAVRAVVLGPLACCCAPRNENRGVGANCESRRPLLPLASPPMAARSGGGAAAPCEACGRALPGWWWWW
jgi:hypothetical protein